MPVGHVKTDGRQASIPASFQGRMASFSGHFFSFSDLKEGRTYHKSRLRRTEGGEQK
jgi:hypothetical protein